MKSKKLLVGLTVVGLVASIFVGCGAKNSTEAVVDPVTYVIETYDGTIINIDESNIISQQKVENVLESELVPGDAEVIAPGRDYVYLADDDFYYVEDTTTDLLTIANK